MSAFGFRNIKLSPPKPLISGILTDMMCCSQICCHEVLSYAFRSKVMIDWSLKVGKINAGGKQYTALMTSFYSYNKLDFRHNLEQKYKVLMTRKCRILLSETSNYSIRIPLFSAILTSIICW